jgi:ubiquinone/menaquinone biosynthesis C-methylase UbiE
MLARARTRLTPNGLLEVHFIHADVTREIPASGQYDTPYDAVVSLFFLDNFTAGTLEHLTRDITYKLRPGGRWYLADFRAGHAWRMRNQFWLWVMYRFFRLTTDIEAHTLVDPTKWLEQHLNLHKRRTWQGGFLVSETWQRPLSQETLSQDKHP